MSATQIIDGLEAKVAKATSELNNVYTERNMLVAALSKLFPASLERDAESRFPEWVWIVYIDLPTGQASWHVPTSEIHFFDHLLREAGREWDGHTTPEKYGRLFALKPLFIYK